MTSTGACGSACSPTAVARERLPAFLAAVLTCFTHPLSAQTAAPAQAPAVAVKNVSAEDAEKLLKEKKEIVVLDLRTEAEFKGGHIAGAKNIDFLGDD